MKHIFYSLFVALSIVTLSSFPFIGKSQIATTTNQTAAQLAQKLVGAGVTISNPTLSCAGNAQGIFVSNGSTIGIDSGVVLTTGNVQGGSGGGLGIANPASSFASTSNGGGGVDAQLSSITANPLNDICKLEFDFIPTGDSIKFDYKFGSEEYPEFTCGSVNDAFGFFISGPGITGSQNLALIPGTTVPISINTVNNTSCGIANVAYYINAATSPNLVYDGTTVILQALAAVIPCSTYHLKLAIADGGDSVYDSGVFIKAGSLTSNAITLASSSGAAIVADSPTIVRECFPGVFNFRRAGILIDSQVIHYQIAGNAINGIDYVNANTNLPIADSIIMQAGDSTAQLFVQALAAAPPTGPRDIILYIQAPSCAVTTFVDTATITIIDSLPVNIINPDTLICKGQEVHLVAEGFPNTIFQWTPSTYLDNPAIFNPTASPLTTITYIVSGNVPGSGCVPSKDSIKITIQPPLAIDLGADIITCLGTPVQLTAVVSDTGVTPYVYTWTPVTNLSDPTIPNPVFSPSAVDDPGTDYILTVEPTGTTGCTGSDTINIRVLPDDFNLYNGDTTVLQQHNNKY